MPIKVSYSTITRVNKKGEVKHYPTKTTYEVKYDKTQLTPQQIDEIKQKIAAGVKKKRILADYDISLYILNKILLSY